MDLVSQEIPGNKDISLPKASPLTRRLSALTLGFCSLLVFVTALHWGGMIRSVSVWLYFAGAALWLLIGWSSIRNHSRQVIVFKGLDLVVLIWLLYATLAWHFSPARYPARFELLWIFSYAAVFLSLRNVVHNQRWLLALLITLLTAATLSATFGFLHLGEGTPMIWGQLRPDYGVRMSGTFGCPNHFGNFMALSAFTALGLCFYNRFSWPVRILLFYIFGMLTAALFFSISRGSYLAWTAGLAAVLFSIPGRKYLSLWLKALVLLLILAGLGAFAWVISQNAYANSRVHLAPEGDIRMILIRDALKIWQDHPALGSGMATFDFAHQRVHDKAFVGRAVYTHNDYLNLLADYGSTGFAIVLVFFCMLTWQLWRRQYRAESHLEQTLSFIGCCAITAMTVHSATDFNFHIPACSLAFFSLTAIGTAAFRRTPVSAPLSAFINCGIAVIALAIALFMIIFTFKTAEGLQFFNGNEDEITALNTSQIEEQATRLLQADSEAFDLLEKAGDALRVKAATLGADARKARLAGDDARAVKLLREREKLGQEALHYYEQGAAANPLYDNLLMKRGLLLDVLNRPDEAYLYYAQAMKNQPRNGFFKYYFGFHLVAIGEYALAREQFKAALDAPTVDKTDNGVRLLAKQALQALDKLPAQP